MDGQGSSAVETPTSVTLIPGYTTVDLAHRHEFKDSGETEINLAVKNVFDEKHFQFARDLDYLLQPRPPVGGFLQERTWIVSAARRF